jgi:hypothetical protein
MKFSSLRCVVLIPFTFPSLSVPSPFQIAEEMVQMELQDFDSVDVDQVIQETMEDFPNSGDCHDIDTYAAHIARGNICESTRTGHYQYAVFHDLFLSLSLSLTWLFLEDHQGICNLSPAARQGLEPEIHHSPNPIRHPKVHHTEVWCERGGIRGKEGGWPP